MILEADLIYHWNKYYSFLTILMPPFSILNLLYLPILRFKSQTFNQFVCVNCYFFYLGGWIILYNIVCLMLVPVVWVKTFISIISIPDSKSVVLMLYYIQWFFLGLPYLFIKHFYVDLPNFLKFSFHSVENKSRLSEISKLGNF